MPHLLNPKSHLFPNSSPQLPLNPRPIIACCHPKMALLLLIGMLMLAMAGNASCTWCVCKDMPDAVLQKALDYACGAGADCNPTRQNGQCFLPNTVRAHCSYAVNSYYQKKGQSQGSCDFSGAATISTSDPSVTGCSYPATASGSNTASQGTTNVPKTGGTSTTTTSVPNSSNNPYPSSNGAGGVGGTGTGNGLGSSGPGGYTDLNDSAASVALFTPSLTTTAAAVSFFLLGSLLLKGEL